MKPFRKMAKPLVYKEKYSDSDIFFHFYGWKTDKGDNGYEEYYEKIFAEHHPKSILEIGIRTGGSLLAWRSLFPNARVVGVDIDIKNGTDPRMVRLFKQRNIEVYECDATLPSLFDYIGNDSFDLIVDDGSHFYKHQRQSFDLLRNKFNHYYVMEDVRWRHDETENYIKSYGYNVERYPCVQQLQIKANKHFLETNEGSFYSALYRRVVSGVYRMEGEQVVTPMEFWMIRQLT